jgi:hypothetical protein
MDHDFDKLLQFLRQVITLSPNFLKKSSTYNNLVAMAATMVCNYNETHGFSRHGQGPQSVFMNGCVHHYMRELHQVPRKTMVSLISYLMI